MSTNVTQSVNVHRALNLDDKSIKWHSLYISLFAIVDVNGLIKYVHSFSGMKGWKVTTPSPLLAVAAQKAVQQSLLIMNG